MTSTKFSVGLSETGRISSKVLKPPGGDSHDIFGTRNKEELDRNVLKDFNKNMDLRAGDAKNETYGDVPYLNKQVTDDGIKEKEKSCEGDMKDSVPETIVPDRKQGNWKAKHDDKDSSAGILLGTDVFGNVNRKIPMDNFMSFNDGIKCNASIDALNLANFDDAQNFELIDFSEVSSTCATDGSEPNLIDVIGGISTKNDEITTSYNCDGDLFAAKLMGDEKLSAKGFLISDWETSSIQEESCFKVPEANSDVLEMELNNASRVKELNVSEKGLLTGDTKGLNWRAAPFEFKKQDSPMIEDNAMMSSQTDMLIHPDENSRESSTGCNEEKCNSIGSLDSINKTIKSVEEITTEATEKLAPISGYYLFSQKDPKKYIRRNPITGEVVEVIAAKFNTKLGGYSEVDAKPDKMDQAGRSSFW